MRCFLSSIVVFIVSVNIVTAEPASKPNIIDKSNFEKLGYAISVDTPRPAENYLKRFNVKFPRSLDRNFEYAYSKALYAKEGKTLISYRPQDISYKESYGEYYIVADEAVIECLSVVNVYLDKRVEGHHPPSKGIAINLSSFLDNAGTCKGGQNANNIW